MYEMYQNIRNILVFFLKLCIFSNVFKILVAYFIVIKNARFNISYENISYHVMNLKGQLKSHNKFISAMIDKAFRLYCISYASSSVFSYGVLVGIGAGLAFPPTVYIVTSYFVRLRGLANGLCISGSALGSIFLPPVLGFLLREYGYR